MAMNSCDTPSKHSTYTLYYTVMLTRTVTLSEFHLK